MRGTPWLNPPCPYCSAATKKHGSKGELKRYLCGECKHTFYREPTSDGAPLEPKEIPENITRTNIGQVIRDLRGNGGWSMQKLADHSGYCVTTIYMIENNKQCGGYWRTVCDLIDTMGYDVNIKKREVEQ